MVSIDLRAHPSVLRMPGAVFLSYASQDAEAARRLRDVLCSAGVEVWFDQSELRGGDAWDQKIRRQIKECALFIPIISANTQTRPEGYFRLEWHLADQRTHLMGKNRVFLLPVCLDGTPHQGSDVPDSFTSVQWTRVNDNEGSMSFVEQVRRILGETVPVPVAVPKPTPAAVVTNTNSLAVLAFANLSNEKENEYFSDGISEELLNALAKVQGLNVSARTSAFYFKGKNLPIPEIARQLGVAYVVEGSVRKAGDRVRITAQLIKAADGFHVWSETFTRDLKDIFAVQDEIAGLIAQSLSLKLSKTSPAPVVNPEAYRLLLEGRAIFHREVPDDYAKAIACFKASLKIDENSALTWAHLAQAYYMSGASGALSPLEASKLGHDAAEKAINLDPGLSKGYGTLAMVNASFIWDWKEARRAMQQAIALSPGDAEILSFQAVLCAMFGRSEEGLVFARKAVSLDPVNFFSSYSLIRNLYNLGLFVELERQVSHLTALNPSLFRLKLFQTNAYLIQGRVEEAADALEPIAVGWARLTGLACVRYAQGRIADSNKILNEMKEKHGQDCAFQISTIHAFRNEFDDAFAWLERSYQGRDAGTSWIKGDPLFAAMRADARWEPFLRKVGLADDQLT